MNICERLILRVYVWIANQLKSLAFFSARKYYLMVVFSHGKTMSYFIQSQPGDLWEMRGAEINMKT